MKIRRKSMQTAYAETGGRKRNYRGGNEAIEGQCCRAETRLLRRMQCCQVETGRTQMHISRRFSACVPYHVPRCV